MIKYVKHHSIDFSKYNQCIKLDKLGLVYGYSWYLDSVCQSWDALVLNDYDAVWPLPIRSKFGIRYFYRPFGVQQLGIFSKMELSDEHYQVFLQEMVKHCSFADVYLNEDQLISVSDLKPISTTINRNYVLDLQRSYREVYHGYNSNTRRSIKKANDNPLSIFEHDSPEVLVDLFQRNRGGELQLSQEFYHNLKKLMYKSLHNGVGSLWTVYGPGNLVYAGAFFMETETRSTMLFTGLDELGKDTRAMFYLLNEYFILNTEKGRVFDFEGSNNEGIGRFYKGFGATEHFYQQIKYNGLPLPLKWLKK